MTHAFVTGATGLIGRWLVPELTRRGSEVTLVIRRADARRAEYLAWVASHGGIAELVTLVEGDLASPGLGLSDADRARARTATDFFHAGALMQFAMSEEVARRANVDGTQALVELALEAPNLRRFVLIGGFKIGDDASFHEVGIDPDAPYVAAAYAPLYRSLGAYEASKMEADHLVRDAARTRDLPITRIHPGGVIGDARTGETTQFVGFAPLVEQLWFGKLPAVPGGARHWLPLISVDFLAAFTARVPELPETRGASYSLLDDQTPMLADVVAIAATRIGVRAPTRRIPIGLVQFLMPSRAEELSFISDRRFDVQPTVALARKLGLAWPDLVTAIERNVDFLIATRFGKQAAPSHARLARVGGAQTFLTGTMSDPDRVLLHGLPLDADSWDAVDSLLAGSSLRADLPGLGRSAAARSTPREWMTSLLAPITRPPVIVAHSLGTLYALELAAAQPERVAALVLISPFFLQGAPPAIMRWAPSARAAGRMVRRRHLEALVAGSPRATTPVLDGPASHLRRPGAGARFGEALAIAHRSRGELQAMLAAVNARIPVLIIHGETDPLVVAAGGARVVELAGTGHFPQLDQPERVAQLIRELTVPAAVALAASSLQTPSSTAA
ncbi:MAG: alpha/beta fold hydrolase [Deltaproteobacteria bacterium]|nr:alpha/beta fold hydrolase [Deltaproteobacteria bacterium]